MKLDLKNFHKIECDGKCTTLQHPNGHQIKVAHKGLSKEHREELDALPTKMAKGGYAKFAQKFDPSIKGSKASGASEAKPMKDYPEYKMPRSEGYTEPDDMGTKIPRQQMQAELSRQEPYNDAVIESLHHEGPPYGALSPKAHYPPCINPSCKSFGKSHPNCRCYGGNPEVGHKQGMFAEGGEVDSFCSKDNPHQPGCEYFKEGGMAEGEEGAGQPQATPAPQPEAPQANMNPEAATGQAPAEPAQSAPDQPELPAAINQFQAQKQSHLQQMANEQQGFENDLNAGHITPETYSSLFGNSSTLGKIGTIFGMLVGGAGAGLSKQPNMLMEMMNNQIKNDLSAQQNSVTNKQNFLKINQQNLANNANVNATNQDTAIKSYAQAMTQMNATAFHHLVQQTQKLPDGSPQKQQQQAVLATMWPQIQQANLGILDKAASAAALSNVINPQSGGNQPNTMMMKSGLMGPEFKEMGSDIEQKTIPGVPGRADRPIAPADRDQVQAMNVLSDKAQDLMNYAKQHKGTLSPSERAVAKQKSEEMINFYNNSIQGGVLTEGRLAWLDSQIKKNPTGLVTQLMGNQARLQEIKDSNDHRKDFLLSKYGLKNPESLQPMTQAKGQQSQPSSAPMISKSGKEIVHRNGKTYYK